MTYSFFIIVTLFDIKEAHWCNSDNFHQKSGFAVAIAFPDIERTNKIEAWITIPSDENKS